MTLVMKNFVAILIIFGFHSRAAEDPIGLKRFIWANLIHRSDCSGVEWKIESIFMLKNSTRRGETLSCQKGQLVLNLNEDNLRQSDSDNTCPISKNCSYCFCIPKTLDRSKLGGSSDHASLLSLRPLVSDTANNMVITGLKFKLDKDRIIQLKMQQGKLLSSGAVDKSKNWKDLEDFQKLTTPAGPPLDYTKLKFDEDVVLFSFYTRTVYLDKIFVPDDYVVTGVKFSRFDTPGDQKGVQMLVRGTYYDSSYTLMSGTDRWYDYTNSTVKDASYEAGSSRTEISLKDCDIPSPGPENRETEGTNKLIKFRPTSPGERMESKVIPYIESQSVETVNSSFLRGVELSHKGKLRSGGYIILKLHYHQSSETTAKLAATKKMAATAKLAATKKMAAIGELAATEKMAAIEKMAATEKLTGSKQSTNSNDIDESNNDNDSVTPRPKRQNSAATTCFQLIFIIILPLIIILQ